MSQTQPTSNGKAFSDLFKTLTTETASSAPNPENTASNSATGAVPGSQPSEAAKDGTVSQESVFSSLNHTSASTNSATGATATPGSTPGTPGSSVSVGGMVQAEWVVNLMDALVPAAIVAGFYAGGVKLRKSQFQLSQSEKATIAPLMKQCLDSLMVNFDNPWNALAVTLVVIYGSKAAEFGLVSYLDKRNEKKEKEALDEKIRAAEMAIDPAKLDPSNQSMNDLQTGAVQNGRDEITEAEIKTVVKARKVSRAKALEWIKKQRGL